MTKEEILKEIEEIKDAIFVSNRRMDVLEAEWKKQEEESKPWKPEIGESYYYVDSVHMTTDFFYWDGDEYDYVRYNAGNCFSTKERAEQVAEKIKMLLKLEQYHDMFCPDYVPDWSSRVERKHYVYYDTLEKQWEHGHANHCKDAAQVYFDSKETTQKVCDLLNREDDENELDSSC